MTARERFAATILRFGICGAYGTLRSLFGPERLSYALYDSPDLIDAILDHWASFTCRLAGRFCPAIRFDYAFLWEDMAFKTGPLMSPDHFRRFILPRYVEVLGHLRARHGIELFMVDSDGNNPSLLPLFVQSGVNLFTPLEINADMDPVRIREAYPHLALLGGIDKRALPLGRDAIRREIERKVPVLLSKGRYFPSLDHHVTADASLDAFGDYLEILREVESAA